MFLVLATQSLAEPPEPLSLADSQSLLESQGETNLLQHDAEDAVDGRTVTAVAVPNRDDVVVGLGLGGVGEGDAAEVVACRMVGLVGMR